MVHVLRVLEPLCSRTALRTLELLEVVIELGVEDILDFHINCDVVDPR